MLLVTIPTALTGHHVFSLTTFKDCIGFVCRELHISEQEGRRIHHGQMLEDLW